MHIRLDGKTALVTGSTRGIGYTTAKMLGEAGAQVIVNGRGQDAVDQAVASLRQEVPDAVFRGLAADIAASTQQVIVSTHVLDYVRDYPRVLWLEQGQVRADGPGDQVCAAYEAWVRAQALPVAVEA